MYAHTPACTWKLLSFTVNFYKVSIFLVNFSRKRKKKSIMITFGWWWSASSWPDVLLAVSCTFFNTSVSSCLPYLLSGFLFYLKKKPNQQTVAWQTIMVMSSALGERVVGAHLIAYDVDFTLFIRKMQKQQVF